MSFQHFDNISNVKCFSGKCCHMLSLVSLLEFSEHLQFEIIFHLPLCVFCNILLGVQSQKKGTFGLQLGYGNELIRNTKWRELGTFSAHNVSPKKKLMEFAVGHNAIIKPGTEITCRHFMPGQLVDVQGVSKDKGFQGVMKRWGFKGGPATHGSSKFHRRRGAMGGSADAAGGGVWKGKRMPGHMGNKNYTKSGLRVFRLVLVS